MSIKQKKSGKIGFSVTVLLLTVSALSLCVSFALAQEQGSGTNENSANNQQANQLPTVVATVNIHNAAIVSQDNNNFEIAFDINNRENVQPGVRYGVELQKIADGEFVNITDEKAYPETLTLGQNSTLHRKVEYQAPSFLNGDFEIWVISKLENGLILALGKAGTAKLNGSGEFMQILPETCFLSVSGEKNHYTPDQGVDIAKEETLQVSCQVRNNFKTDVAATPWIELRQRSSFGQAISKEKLPVENFKSAEGKTLNLIVPKPDKPQAYEAILTFLDSKGRIISNTTSFHFVLRGISATIQNLTLDRSSYQKGDAAKVRFLFTPSADSFPGARGKGTDMDVVILKLDIKDKDGGLCGSAKETFSIDKPAKTQLDVPISATCPGAVAAAVLTDKGGNVLDSIIPKNQAGSEQPIAQELAKSKQLFGYVLIGLFLILLIAGLILWKKRKNGNIVRSSIFLLFAATAFFFSRGASADTVCGPINESMHACCMSECATVNIDKSEYLPEENITATASTSYWRSCNNGSFSPLQVDSTINKQKKTIIPLKRGGKNIFNRSAKFTAEDASGTYNAFFEVMWGGRRQGFGGFLSIDAGRTDQVNIPYQVSASKAPINGDCADKLSFCHNTALGSDTQGLCVSPESPANVTGNPNGPWSWYCPGSNGGSNSVQCSASVIQAPQCRTIDPPCEGSSLSDTSVSALCAGGSTTVTGINDSQKKATWRCGNGCGEIENCELKKKNGTEGQCGSANGTSICDGHILALQELCAKGAPTPSNPDTSGFEFSWKCGGGACGGQSVDCSAKGKKSCGWIETNP